MASEVLLKDGFQLLFADHLTDFGAAPATAAKSLILAGGTPVDVQYDGTAQGAAGGSPQRESAKADLGNGNALWGEAFACYACIEHATAPAESETVDFYWAPSTNATAGTGNMALTTGADAAYTPTAGQLSELIYIGSLVLTTAVLNVGYVGMLYPTTRWGSLVVINQSAADLFNSSGGMDETHIVLNEIIAEAQ